MPPAPFGFGHASPSAKPLARGLARRWGFLQRFLDDADDGRRSPKVVAREYGLRVAMIAAVLGKRLSRRWTPDVVRLVERYGLTGTFAAVRTVIGAGDAHSPLKYLATVLDRALTNPAAPPVPHYSPVRGRVRTRRPGRRPRRPGAAQRGPHRPAAGGPILR